MTVSEEDYKTACVSIDGDNINAEYIRCSADIAFWSSRYAQVVHARETWKLAAEREYARAFHAGSTTLKDSGEKRPTTAMVESFVMVDADYINARQQQILIETQKAEVSGILKAISAKRDMLISLGANMRAELEGDPSIKESRHAE